MAVYDPNSILFNKYKKNHWESFLIGGPTNDTILSSDDEEILVIMKELEDYALRSKWRQKLNNVIRRYQQQNNLPDEKMKEILQYLDVERYQKLCEDRIETELQSIRLQLIHENDDSDIEILNFIN